MAPGGRTVLTRLNKILVRKGMCSRREADRYIEAGLVEVDGVVVSKLGAKVEVEVDALKPDVRLLEGALALQAAQRTVLFHKPLGIVSCQPERADQVPAIRLCTTDREYRPRNNNRKQQQNQKNRKETNASTSSSLPSSPVEPFRMGGWAVAGRLDVNSTGLLVLTQSGRIASRLIGGTNNNNNNSDNNYGDSSNSGNEVVEKEYLVRIAPSSARSSSREPLLNGTKINSLAERKLEELRAGIRDGGDFLSARSVERINEEQLRIVLTAGRHHHIRRMCGAVGWTAGAIKRVRVGNIALSSLPLGCWRYLQPQESF